MQGGVGQAGTLQGTFEQKERMKIENFAVVHSGGSCAVRASGFPSRPRESRKSLWVAGFPENLGSTPSVVCG